MSDFDPGGGWREVSPDHRPAGPGEFLIYDGATNRAWFREEPVPPLPTEPYTVIRVTYRDSLHTQPNPLMFAYGFWMKIGGDVSIAAGDLADAITGFEVLAEPRRVIEKVVLDQVRSETAKAVLDRIRSASRTTVEDAIRVSEVEREFGVQVSDAS